MMQRKTSKKAKEKEGQRV
jgi:hypothetical protein